ncbi:histidine kinase N-terminal 7TM domain-containing protein [Halapricum desulfuricans]|uniref:histidine kinase n=1 Tax=Halapricum desulfuricans TaxID=2841257 RepID=A0A897MVZ3_9EURY|nr:histidine kinase N-terminal 7TM domain-containing protein [Halapricum desulfuricans]QSG04674.1 Signal transduction histidine kinase, contains PAS domain [Halapricum desulfuricans]
MGWELTIHAVPLFLAPAVAALVAGAIYANRSVGGQQRLLALVVVAGWWSLAYGIALVQTDLGAKVLFHGIMFAGVGLTPVTWLVFVVGYTGGDEWVTRRRVAALAAVPLLTALVAITNAPVGSHELFWTDPSLDASAPPVVLDAGYGPLFWAHSVYAYTLLVISGGYLLRLALFTDRIHRSQAVTLVVVSGIPIGANVAHLAGVVPGAVDPTPPALVVSGLVIATRYRLLTVVPAARQLARSELIERTPDPVIVVSDGDKVLDLNPAAASLFDTARSDAVGRQLDRVAPDLAGTAADLGPETAQTDVAVEASACASRYFDVQATPISAGYGVVTGRVLTLREITDRRRREQRLSVLNRLLRHDLRNVMTAIRGNAELVEQRVDDPEVRERMAVIERNVDTIVERREKFDSVLRSLDVDTEPVEITSTVRAVIDDADGDAKIGFEAPADCYIEGHPIVRIALEEVLENALEHATERIDVAVETADSIVELTVCDDGDGIADHEVEPLSNGRETPLEHTSGVGLWTVKWVVEALDGSVGFETDDGTCITLALPRATGVDK